MKKGEMSSSQYFYSQQIGIPKEILKMQYIGSDKVKNDKIQVSSKCTQQNIT